VSLRKSWDKQGHCVRAFFVTSAQQAGLGNDAISRRTGHRTEKAMYRYCYPTVLQQQFMSSVCQNIQGGRAIGSLQSTF